MRRIILAGLALVAAAAVFEVPSAQAQVSSPRNPWCIRDGTLGRGSWDCSYHNRAQCEQSALGAGGFCTTNPTIAAAVSRTTRAATTPGAAAHGAKAAAGSRAVCDLCR